MMTVLKRRAVNPRTLEHSEVESPIPECSVVDSVVISTTVQNISAPERTQIVQPYDAIFSPLNPN